ncbi:MULTISPECIES: helix-turn-helix domain-containing protein [unclassified Maridesulfovibrio]|uniref:helix-turn-helix domain-containing protein n=1 Tax=unclassified Maridesulfovibrio TaxID=2794999 RepID=UPI003B40EF6E
MSRTSAVETTNKAWESVPDWVLALAQTCDDQESQHQTAKRVGISATAVNQILKNKYPGSLPNVEKKVRAALMTDVVTCPVLGEIGSSQCLENQSKPFSAASSLKVQLWKACQKCKQNLNRKE